MNKVLLAGGAGFLGSHFIDSMIAAGHEITVVDNLMSGNRTNVPPEIKFYEHDIIEVGNFDSFHPLSKLQFDTVINFACPASPPLYQRDPVHTMMTNVVGTKNLLDIARKNNAVFVQASTSEVYGDPEVSPQPESYRGCVNTLGPRANYDEGKRAAEALVMDYHRIYGTRVKIARIFNTYGTRMDPNDGRVVSNFIVQALQDKPLTIYGDGTQTRSFCYVSDLIRGFMALTFKTPDDFTGPVNLGSQIELTMNQIASEVIRLTDSKSVISTHPLPIDDPRQRRPDTTLARLHLDWTPTVSLEEGLARTVTYFRTRLGL